MFDVETHYLCHICVGVYKKYVCVCVCVCVHACVQLQGNREDYKYRVGSSLVWCSSKHGIIHIGRLHCLQIYVVVLRALPLFRLQTKQSNCWRWPSSFLAVLAGKCLPERRSTAGWHRGDGPAGKGASAVETISCCARWI